MKRALLVLLAFLALAAVPAAISSCDLYDSLLAYHEKRVPVHMRHEDEPARQERIRWIAESIIKACADFPLDEKLGWTSNQCIALAATMAKWESGLTRAVHEGSKKGPSGELCLFQIHRGVTQVPDPLYRTTEAERLETVGLSAEATDRCALAGVKDIAWQIHRCGMRAGDALSPARMFEQYHWPDPSCTYKLDPMSMARSRSYHTLLTQLVARAQ